MTDERDVEAYLRRKIEHLGGLCIKLPGEIKRGIPDRLCLLPGGKVVLVELKKPDGELSEAQKLQQAKLSRMGHKVHTLWAKADVDKLMRELERQ